MKLWLPEEETLVVHISADGKKVTVDNQVSMRPVDSKRPLGFQGGKK